MLKWKEHLFMKDNKGQVLVMFVLLLPIILLFIGIITDTGLLFIEKRKIDNNVKNVIRYGLNNLTINSVELKGEMTNTLTSNISEIDRLTIDIDNGTITILLNKKKKSLFSLITSKNYYDIKSNYNGYIDKGKMIVKEG